jgi:hypothetical protein
LKQRVVGSGMDWTGTVVVRTMVQSMDLDLFEESNGYESLGLYK